MRPSKASWLIAEATEFLKSEKEAIFVLLFFGSVYWFYAHDWWVNGIMYIDPEKEAAVHALTEVEAAHNQ